LKHDIYIKLKEKHLFELLECLNISNENEAAKVFLLGLHYSDFLKPLIERDRLLNPYASFESIARKYEINKQRAFAIYNK
jgi:hypothetical protein